MTKKKPVSELVIKKPNLQPNEVIAERLYGMLLTLERDSYPGRDYFCQRLDISYGKLQKAHEVLVEDGRLSISGKGAAFRMTIMATAKVLKAGVLAKQATVSQTAPIGMTLIDRSQNKKEVAACAAESTALTQAGIVYEDDPRACRLERVFNWKLVVPPARSAASSLLVA